MDHDADRDSDKNAVAYGGPESEWLSRAIYEILWTIKSLEDLPLWTTVCEIQGDIKIDAMTKKL